MTDTLIICFKVSSNGAEPETSIVGVLSIKGIQFIS